jgi:hypothetical protein
MKCEIDALWQIMVPGVVREPQSDLHVIVVRAPSFVGFRRASRGVVAGRIADPAYGSPAYHTFVDIVDDLIDSCRTHGAKRNLLLARLPAKTQKLRVRLSKSSNQAMQRTASRAAIYLSRVGHPRIRCDSRFTGLAVADLESR